jgi:hypothetical protein
MTNNKVRTPSNRALLHVLILFSHHIGVRKPASIATLFTGTSDRSRKFRQPYYPGVKSAEKMAPEWLKWWHMQLLVCYPQHGD